MNWEHAAGSPFAAGVAKPTSLAVADLDEDGHLDVVAGNDTASGATISVLLGDGNGGLQAAGPPLATGMIPVALDIGDLSGDGNLDVVAGNEIPDSSYGRGTVSLYLGDGNGGLVSAGDAMSVGGAVTAVALGDFTGDGTPDAAVSHLPNPETWDGFTFTIAGAIGTGEDGGFYPFQRLAGTSSQTMRTGDLNSDGRADVAMADKGNGVDVLLGQAPGGVTRAPGCEFDCGGEVDPNNTGNASLTLGHFDGAANLDVAVGNSHAESVTVLRIDGTGTLTAVAPPVRTIGFDVSAVGAGDFNRDGALDVAAVDTPDNEFTVLPGDGAGGLRSIRPLAHTGGAGSGVYERWREVLRVGDFDEDDHPDVVVANPFSGTVAVLLYRHGYVRPRSANFIQVPLVPAYARCRAPRNRWHGPPFEEKSCFPPTQESSLLTLGTADSNQHGTSSTGSVKIEAIAGLPASPADEADMRVTTSITDVRNASDLSDYTGSVDVALGVRLTDRVGGTAAEGFQTTQSLPLEIPVPCNATGDAGVGATCQLTTTVDTVIPGAVVESRRSIWELDAVRVLDADGRLFEKQGYFVP